MRKKDFQAKEFQANTSLPAVAASLAKHVHLCKSTTEVRLVQTAQKQGVQKTTAVRT